MKTQFLSLCLLLSLSSFNVQPSDNFKAVTQQNNSLLSAQSIVAMEQLLHDQYPLFQKELIKLSFEQVAEFLNSLPENTLAQVIMNNGGIVGNGGGIIVGEDGQAELADLYIDFKELSSTGELPHYYQPFSFDQYPNLENELLKMIDFLNIRYLNIRDTGENGSKLISTDLSDFHIFNTPILLKQVSYPVIDGLNFQSIAFTYESSVTDLETFSVQNQRIIEIRPELFAALPNNRARALLLIHEFLHHDHSNIYDRYTSRYILISSLVENLNKLMPALDQQYQTTEKVFLNNEEMEAAKTLQIILERYKGNNDSDLNQFISAGGGVTNSAIFAKNNYIDLRSNVNLRSGAGTMIFQPNKVPNSNNIFQNVSLLLKSSSEFDLDFDCDDSLFRNIKNDTRKYTIIGCTNGNAQHIENTKNVNMDIVGNNNSIINVTAPSPSGHFTTFIDNGGSQLFNINFTDITRLKSYRSSIKNIHTTGKRLIYQSHIEIEIVDSTIENSTLENDVHLIKSLIDHSVVKNIEVKNGTIHNSKILSCTYTSFENISFQNSNILVFFFAYNIISKKPVTLENLNLIGHLDVTFSSNISRTVTFDPDLVYKSDLKEGYQNFVGGRKKIRIKSSQKAPRYTKEIDKTQQCGSLFFSFIGEVKKISNDFPKEFPPTFQNDLTLFCEQE